MAKQAKGPRITAIDADGKETRIRAERLRVEFGHGRSLVLSFPDMPWGDLDVQASGDSDDAVAVLSVRALASNHLSLRADLCHHPVEIDPIDLPESAPVPVFRVRVTKAVDGADKANAPKKHQLRRWAQAAVQRNVDVGIRLVGEDEGRALNSEYRGKDYATNVLTFDYGAVGDERGAQAAARADADAVLEGDLVLCVPVVVREAAEQGKTLDAHFAHLVVHGMLHLQGHDHEDDAQADAMESLERVMLAALGYPDPYA